MTRKGEVSLAFWCLSFLSLCAQEAGYFFEQKPTSDWHSVQP